MIKTEELRIGNLVSVPFEQEGIVSFIASHNSVGVMVNAIYSYYSVKDVSPIKLTEEWLIKFGIDGCHRGEGYANFWSPNRFDIHHKLTSDDILEAGFYWGDLYTKIEYVHDLQNLYFAITRKELALKH